MVWSKHWFDSIKNDQNLSRNRLHDPAKAFITACMVASLILLLPKPAFASFDPPTAFNKFIMLGQYFIVISAIYGIIKTLGKARFLAALCGVVIVIVIYGLIEPTTFMTLGHDVIRWFGVNSGNSTTIPQVPTTPVDTTPVSTPTPPTTTQM